MSEQFKPGQTVWHRSTHEMFDIIAVNRPSCWCWSVSRCHYETISEDMLTTTDPNAEPTPQKSVVLDGFEAGWLLRAAIRVAPAHVTDSVRVWQLVPPEPDEPLTEEWLSKVGLSEGIKSECVYGSYRSLLQIRQCAEPDIWNVILEGTGDRSGWHGIVTNQIKTIGDVRTLCRLLGVPLTDALERGAAGR